MMFQKILQDIGHYILLYWRTGVEILFLYYIILTGLRFMKGTRAMPVLKGLVILGVLLFVIPQQLGLEAIIWIMTKLLAISVLAILVVFQPELRRGLARLGQRGMLRGLVYEEEAIAEVVKAVHFLSRRKIGGLIALERQTGLKGLAESGVSIDSQVTSELITTIFMPSTPLHDGGVIIQGSRLTAAGCLFPLSQTSDLEKSVGTRHRAALGLAEETDAAVIVVSEETGNVSMAADGRLFRNVDKDKLHLMLENLFHSGRRRNWLEWPWSGKRE
ncbi:MAG: diadenylate cyclase CdaA [Candidatus Omnitrophica bacterium]|nr:diadenylate cyclase CdaA [Candidatus Omnitrophota bacterium]